jgi:hypothetical protein
MSHLNIVLGAGFSRAAGLPLVSHISDYFNRRIYDQLRMHSSGEWFWLDNGEDVENHNGALNSDHIVYAFVFEEIMQRYGEMKNYEDFFDFLTHQPSEWFKKVFDAAKVHCAKELKLDPDNALINLFTSYQYQKVFEIFNYLIIDTLKIRLPNADLLKEYSAFLTLLERYEHLHVFTLNHDLLLEHLFDLSSRSYSDGFVIEGSMLIGDDNMPQPSFQNTFVGSTHVRKLHGSAGLYQYPAGIDEGGIIHRTGEIIYFKPTTYHNKHMSKRVDATGKVLQTMNLDTSPKFITGKNKNELIQKNPMYSALYKAFESALKKDNDLLIVGYSYFDEHINQVLRSGGPFSHVINVNPGTTYPYSNAVKVTNLKYPKDLASLL